MSTGSLDFVLSRRGVSWLCTKPSDPSSNQMRRKMNAVGRHNSPFQSFKAQGARGQLDKKWFTRVKPRNWPKIDWAMGSVRKVGSLECTLVILDPPPPHGESTARNFSEGGGSQTPPNSTVTFTGEFHHQGTFFYQKKSKNGIFPTFPPKMFITFGFINIKMVIFGRKE